MALSIKDGVVVVAFQRHTLLPPDDCLYALQATIRHLTRSSLPPAPRHLTASKGQVERMNWTMK